MSTAPDREQVDPVFLPTILAALRYWQVCGMADNPAQRSDLFHDLATNGDEQISMDGAGVDSLCEQLNSGEIVLVDSAAFVGCVAALARALEALRNVPPVGEIYDQQHSDTQLAADQVASAALAKTIYPA